MAMLTAYDPFAATNAAFRALDQLTGRAGGLTARPLSGMPMDAYRVGRAHRCRPAGARRLPGAGNKVRRWMFTPVQARGNL